MGIGSRRASTSAATTALLLCFGTVGTAAAEEAPVDDTAISADQTTDINDRQGWEDETDQPVLERTPRRCDGPSTWYRITSKKAYHIPSWWNGTKYKDGPGGTMSVVVTKGGTITGEFTGTAEFEAGRIIAKAKASVSLKIGASVTITTGHTYTREISKNKYGHLQYGAWGYKVGWKKYRASGNGCDGVEISRGTATLPTKETGWKYWETKS
ncbi:hypothetical protein AB0H69_03710 [Streptomyces phaeochromogenes]|uniref:hypothetical protein n=1 Tax=Streptomyces phaeochromogenes TaxID=1923 RepID=UPI0033DF357F